MPEGRDRNQPITLDLIDQAKERTASHAVTSPKGRAIQVVRA